MRHRIVVAALVVCGVIGVLDIGYHLGRGAMLSVAVGQTADVEVILTGANTQNEAVCFVYSKKSHQLNMYVQRSSGGLELKGIRKLSSDFTEEIDEYPRSQSETAVSKMKQLAEKIAKDKEKKK